MREPHGTWLKQKHFLDKVNLTHSGVIGKAFESWDIAGKCFKLPFSNDNELRVDDVVHV